MVNRVQMSRLDYHDTDESLETQEDARREAQCDKAFNLVLNRLKNCGFTQGELTKSFGRLCRGYEEENKERGTPYS